MFLQPSPGSPDWLTGGAFGIEQRFAATVLLAVLAAWTFLTYRRSSSPTPVVADIEPATGH